MTEHEMILLTIEKPTGWDLMSAEPYQDLPENRVRLRETSETQATFYFDGFVQGSISERCLRFQWNQAMRVERAKPALIRATVYYQPEIRAELNYVLGEACNTSEVDLSQAYNNTRPGLPQAECPTFVGFSGESVEEIQRDFYENMGSYITYTLAVPSGNVNNSSAASSDNNKRNASWLFYRSAQSQFFQWREQLIIPAASLELKQCNGSNLPPVIFSSNSQQEEGEELIIVAPLYASIEPGYPVQLTSARVRVYDLRKVGQFALLQRPNFPASLGLFARMLQRLFIKTATSNTPLLLTERPSLADLVQRLPPVSVMLPEFQCPYSYTSGFSMQLDENLRLFNDSLCRGAAGDMQVLASHILEVRFVESNTSTDTPVDKLDNVNEWRANVSLRYYRDDSTSTSSSSSNSSNNENNDAPTVSSSLSTFWNATFVMPRYSETILPRPEIGSTTRHACDWPGAVFAADKKGTGVATTASTKAMRVANDLVMTVRQLRRNFIRMDAAYYLDGNYLFMRRPDFVRMRKLLCPTK